MIGEEVLHRQAAFRTMNGPDIDSFKAQVKKAKFDVNAAISKRDYDAVLKNFVRTDQLNHLQDEAYASKRGYSIGYVNGKKVMYVSGSRNVTDWVFNVADNFIPASRHRVSNKTSQNLTKIARDEKVDVVVGHSRGGMLVAKMDIDNSKKLSLDGAMRLAPKNRRNVMNLYQKQVLDRVINRGGKNSKAYRVKRVKTVHFISRDRPGQKAYDKRGGLYKPKIYESKYRY